MKMWCPNCDREMIEEDVVRGDEVVGFYYTCEYCGLEIDGDEIEGDIDEERYL